MTKSEGGSKPGEEGEVSSTPQKAICFHTGGCKLNKPSRVLEEADQGSAGSAVVFGSHISPHVGTGGEAGRLRDRGESGVVHV